MLYFVATPIGNLEDISKRALNLLESSKTIICEDTRVAKRLIYLLKQKGSFSPVPKTYISLHSHNEKDVLKQLSPDIFEDSVIYISDAGMPTISDPGALLVQYCQLHDIKYEIIPGANALLLAYAASGFCDSKFLFFGFLPHKGDERDLALQEALYNGYTTIVYESPKRVLKLIEQISAIEPSREIFLIKEATKLYEKKYKAKAKELKEILKNENLKGEWSIVIKGEKRDRNKITITDIKKLNLPKKQTAKLIAKITGKSITECYNELLE